MNLFVHMDDNGDGTTTITMCVDGENVITQVAEMSFLDYLNGMLAHVGSETLEVAGEFVEEHGTTIPNTVEL